MRTFIVLILEALLATGCVLPPALDVPGTQYRICDKHNRYEGVAKGLKPLASIPRQ